MSKDALKYIQEIINNNQTRWNAIDSLVQQLQDMGEPESPREKVIAEIILLVIEQLKPGSNYDFGSLSKDIKKLQKNLSGIKKMPGR